MYEAYWLIDTKPFENTPDPHFLYSSEKHDEALMRLLYSVREHKEGVLLTGEYGSGKTLLSRALLRELEGNGRYKTVLILNPKITHAEFLREILFQLDVDRPAESEMLLQRQLSEALRKIAQENKSAVIIVDEAQTLEVDDFNDLRLLLSVQSDSCFLFTLVLLGHTALREKLFKIEPLKQRIPMRFHLSAMNEADTASYIQHRMVVAGRTEPVFTAAALSLVYRGSEGIPRRINNICDYCLLIGYGRKVNQVGVEIVTEVLKDLDEWRDDIIQQPGLRAI